MDEYRSLLAPYMQSFLQYRKALFHKNSAYEPVLAWMERTSMPRSGRLIRGAIVRKFAAYMNGIGGAAYVLPEKMYGSNTSFVPYIFTDAEMQRLFAAIDSIRPSALQPHKHVVLPVMFRLIYTCGLRPAKARLLPANNVYLDSGEILITETKRSRDRMIVMSEDMRTLCADYNEQRKVLFPDSPFFFPGTDGKAFAPATISREFCKCWAKANPDVPKENLPAVRVYDLRHRFASAAVQRWLDEGADLNAKLPFLRAYMGHASFAQTAYYIHLLPANLTASDAVDWSAFDALIPEV